jgi:hypothetical protein
MTTTSHPDSPGAERSDSQAAGEAGYVAGIADGNLSAAVGLRDYLFGVGVVLRLGRRARRKPEKAAVRRSALDRIPLKLIATIALPIALALAGYQMIETLGGVPLPGAVEGTWSTSDGRYAGRSFWLNADAVAFQNGASTNDFTVHRIQRVKTREVADTLYLTIDYEQGGNPVTLSLVYRTNPAPEIRLRNQPAVRWRRTGSAPVISQ